MSDVTLPSGMPAAVGVVGGGRMGVGIAHAFLLAGCRVTVVERDAAAAAQANSALQIALGASIARETTLRNLSELMAQLTITIAATDLRDAGLVIEAVPEDLAVKSATLRLIEEHIAPEAWIASNTSSLSIDALAAVLEHPARLLGLHFFNPVPSSSLVEIVLGVHTSAAGAATASGWVCAIGKTPIVVQDSPGFASSRLGVVIGLEAIRMLQEGVASAEDIDAAMVLGYKFPVGPLRLTDMVGLDVRLGIAEYLHETLGERFAPPALLREKVAGGQLGRKTGQGFFTWPPES